MKNQVRIPKTELTGYSMVKECGEWVRTDSLPADRKRYHMNNVELNAANAYVSKYGYRAYIRKGGES